MVVREVCTVSAGSRQQQTPVKTIQELKLVLQDPTAQGKTFRLENVSFFLIHGDSYIGEMVITTKNGRIVFCVKVGLEDNEEHADKDNENHQIIGRMWDKFEAIVGISAEEFQKLTKDQQTALLYNITGVYSCNVHIANTDGYNLEISKVEKQV